MCLSTQPKLRSTDQENGTDPQRRKNIILTHMHFDHCSGLADFPKARVHVYRGEYHAFTEGKIRRFTEFAYIPRYIAHHPEFVLYDQVDSKWYEFDAIRLPFEPEIYLIPSWPFARTLRCGHQNIHRLVLPRGRCRRSLRQRDAKMVDQTCARSARRHCALS
ncbi:MAG: MBL fold metallo-hydrolase [Anaerolineales bacterium]|nr:MBL fold metallo-hydrolase [Anaerolineales bacterium]